jgi:hypothetical protein
MVYLTLSINHPPPIQNVNIPIGVFSRSILCNFSVFEHDPSFLLDCEDNRTMETNKERRKNTDENIITFLVTSFENS